MTEQPSSAFTNPGESKVELIEYSSVDAWKNGASPTSRQYIYGLLEDAHCVDLGEMAIFYELAKLRPQYWGGDPDQADMLALVVDLGYNINTAINFNLSLQTLNCFKLVRGSTEVVCFNTSPPRHRIHENGELTWTMLVTKHPHGWSELNEELGLRSRSAPPLKLSRMSPMLRAFVICRLDRLERNNDEDSDGRIIMDVPVYDLS